jgi:hypothetical protein
VVSNLEKEAPHLIPLFLATPKAFERSGMSRTEAVMHYAEEHPDEWLALAEYDADDELARLQAEHYARAA